jgi:hypothetical protein
MPDTERERDCPRRGHYADLEVAAAILRSDPRERASVYDADVQVIAEAVENIIAEFSPFPGPLRMPDTEREQEWSYDLIGVPGCGAINEIRDRIEAIEERLDRLVPDTEREPDEAMPEDADPCVRCGHTNDNHRVGGRPCILCDCPRFVPDTERER